MHVSQKDLNRFFKPAYVQRGFDYYENNRVLWAHVQEANKRLIRASVRGSGGHTYQVQIQLDGENNSVVNIKGKCSCPVHKNCKHVVASMLFYINHQPPLQEELFCLPSDKWLYKLKASKPSQSTPSPSSELLLYVLGMNVTSTSPCLYVNSVKTRLLDKGDYAEPRLYSGSPESKASFMRDDDRFVLLLLNSLKSDKGNSSHVLESDTGAKVLNELIDTGRCHWLDETYPAIRHAPEKTSTLSWKFLPDARQVIQPDELDKDYVVLPLLPPYYLNTKTGDCGILNCKLPEKLASDIISSPPLMPEKADEFRYFVSSHGDKNLPLPVNPNIQEKHGILPTPCLKLVNDEDDFAGIGEKHNLTGIALLSFDYDGLMVHPFDNRKQFIRQVDTGFEVVFRRIEFESEALQHLDEIGFIGDDYYMDGDEALQLEPVHVQDSWLDFMLHQRQSLESEGWRIEIADDFVFQIDQADDWYADIDQASNDWFTLELGIDVDGQHINLLPFLVNYLQSLNGPQAISELRQLPDDYPLLLRQENGHLLHIALIKVRHIIDTLVELYDPDVLDRNGKLEFSRYHSNQLTALDNEHTRLSWAGGESIRKFGQRLDNFAGVKSVIPPLNLKTELRDYQKEGLNWLQFLREYELGGILADDMGLGKTVQTLAHLLVEKKGGRVDCPNLVVAPTSLMVNWKREAARFAPDLKVMVLQGVERKQKFNKIPEYDLVLTTYPLLSRDSDVLLQQQWHMVILDEAQHIKNPKSKAAKTASHLKTRHRLCLTGTPMENHLGELWSQFHFLMPGLLGDEKRFRRLFRNPIEKYQDESRQQQLRERIAPFLLRRDKSEVATELPPKTIIVSEVELEGAQRDLYEAIRVSMHDKVRQVIDSQGIARSQIVILDALLKLRQVCCHPQLVKIPSARKVKHSAKLNQLMEMLPEMVEEGRRILLFSQFTSMLALIEDELVKYKIPYVKLTGQTRNREKPIDEFQSGKIPVFLISLKAGGSGLNLTAADTVIHYDPWWNPAAEQQATDRAHRIGQDKPVFVYKLITVGTVEEKILDMQQKKQALAESLFAEGSRVSGISHDDLQALFEPLA